MTTAFRMALCGIVMTVALGCGQGGRTIEAPTESVTRIGVYDSRAVAVAFVGSEAFKTAMAALEAEHEEAKAAGDEQRVAELEAEAGSRQERLHQQAFSTAPVNDILAHIADQLPDIKAGASVDVIVSKWDEAALSKYPRAERVDVTMALVDALAPTDKQREMAIEIQKIEARPSPKWSGGRALPARAARHARFPWKALAAREASARLPARE